MTHNILGRVLKVYSDVALKNDAGFQDSPFPSEAGGAVINVKE